MTDTFTENFIKIEHPVEKGKISYINKSLFKNPKCQKEYKGGTVVSDRIQNILDTTYVFDEKDKESMKEYIYKQESKYMITLYENFLLKVKFDQFPYPDGSFYVEKGFNPDGSIRYIERAYEMGRYDD